jgi:hypothetical protein
LVRKDESEMAMLDEAKRRAVMSELMQHWSTRRHPTGKMTKPQLLEAIAAVDQWLEAGAQEALRSVLPDPITTSHDGFQRYELGTDGKKAMRVLSQNECRAMNHSMVESLREAVQRAREQR